VGENGKRETFWRCLGFIVSCDLFDVSVVMVVLMTRQYLSDAVLRRTTTNYRSASRLVVAFLSDGSERGRFGGVIGDHKLESWSRLWSYRLGLDATAGRRRFTPLYGVHVLVWSVSMRAVYLYVGPHLS
jgi:hypothetical protein